jgi:hypothetical protein
VLKRESLLLLIQNKKREEKLCKGVLCSNEETVIVGTAAGFRVFESWIAGREPLCIQKVLRQANFIKFFFRGFSRS